MSSYPLPDHAIMTQAFLSRHSAYDGIFFTAVRTTGIFCRTTCHAKKPRLENVSFYPTAHDALHAGFRPCKVCRPLDPAGKPPQWVQQLLDAIEADVSRRWRDQDLRSLHINPATARRWFQSNYGLTFHAYSRARRLGQALSRIQDGSSVIQAAYGEGYDSLSGFNAAFRKLLGASPTAMAGSTVLHIKRIATPLGLMLAAAAATRLYMLEFMDRRAMESQLRGLRRLTGAALIGGESPILATLESQLEDYFGGSQMPFSVPLATPGTPFQQSVWSALRDIPSGQTRSYLDVARTIGQPNAVRAVARANGANRLAIIIPCHRVIGSDGQLAGYGGGRWRKRRLLELEGARLDPVQLPA